MAVDPIVIFLAIVFVIVLLMFLLGGIRIVQPYEQGLVIVLGSFKRILNPGFNWVIPWVTQVIKMDLRTQVFDVPRQEVITKDNSPTNVDAIIYIKVIDPKRAFFEITNYRVATIALAQTTLRARIGDMELDQILYDRHTINTLLRDDLDKATDPWGVKVESVEIREVDPVGPVKAAMEEQTAAERERRAQILRADGKKRAAILEAEGAKQSRILQAEGIRMSKILEAEGARVAKILEMQGEAQALRILTMGAALLDDKALTIKSLDTLSIMANGKATKIIFPFEVSKLLEGASDFIGAGRQTPKSTTSDYSELEARIGKADRILGPIPAAGEMQKEIKQEIRSIEQQVKTPPIMPGGGHEAPLDMPPGLHERPPEFGERPMSARVKKKKSPRR
jgi:regulator of protease activity HflC (stomatin/prohibitin superfamily)